MPAITRQAGAVIGAIQEVRYAHKERKLAERGELEGLSPVTSNEKKPGFDKDDDDDDDDDEDDEDWALDDAAAEFEDEGEDPPEYSEAAGDKKVPMDEVFQLFEKAHSRAFNVNPDKETPLPNPVILPQRRPKDKRRGFVRAYAPSLAECKGIDQATFMRFLNDFDKASRASPVFDVVNTAALALGAIPNPLSPVTMAVSIAAQFVSNTGKEIQGRYRTNAYLNMMNDFLFKPHGLYCMIMTYKPQQPGNPIVEVDIGDNINTNITKANDVPDSSVHARFKNLRISSGTTRGSCQLPEAAPLVYPGLDAKFASSRNPTAKAPAPGGLRGNYNFVQEYMDKREQAIYAYRNPNDTKLAQAPDHQFHSKFADPTHPMYAGGLMTFLSGGKIDTGAWYRERRVRRAERRAARKGVVLTEAEKLAISRRPGGLAGLAGRYMNQGVLYLLVANLPTEEEQAQARAQLAEAKALKEAQRKGSADSGYSSLHPTSSRGSVQSSSSTAKTSPSPPPALPSKDEKFGYGHAAVSQEPFKYEHSLEDEKAGYRSSVRYEKLGYGLSVESNEKLDHRH